MRWSEGGEEKREEKREEKKGHFNGSKKAHKSQGSLYTEVKKVKKKNKRRTVKKVRYSIYTRRKRGQGFTEEIKMDVRKAGKRGWGYGWDVN